MALTSSTLLFIDKVPASIRTAFQKEVVAISKRQNIKNPNWLMAVINSETAQTFSPSIQNKVSGATGLIQFMPSTAKALGTTTTALAQMDHLEQLVYVEKYIAMTMKNVRATAIEDYDDMYFVVFYPAAIGKPDTYVIARPGTAVYNQNAGTDMNKDGTITVADFKAFARKLIPILEIPNFLTKNQKKGVKLFFWLTSASIVVFITIIWFQNTE
jgi:hypothetical protein